MPIINLPDGKTIEIPSDLNRDQINSIKRKIAETYSNYSPQKKDVSYLDPARYAYALRNIPKGVVDTTLTSATGISSFFDAGNDNFITQGLQSLQDDFRKKTEISADKKYGDLFTSKVGSGIGSFATFGAPRLATTALRSQKAFSPAVLDKLDKYAGRTGLGIAFGAGVSDQANSINELRNEGKKN